MLQSAKDLFMRTLEIHIRTIGLDYTFHKETGNQYEELLETVHKIGEMMESVGDKTSKDTDIDDMTMELYDMNAIMIQEFEDAINKEENKALQNLYIDELGKAYTRATKLKSLSPRIQKEIKKQYNEENERKDEETLETTE